MNGEKPYDFVLFPEKPPERKQGVGQDRLREGMLSGTLILTLETLTPVHVGSGYSDFVKTQNAEHLAALQASKRVIEGNTLRRQYLIPGASLKGTVRSLVEALSRSCVRVTKHNRFLPHGYGGCRNPENLCVACRLFGAQDYQGHLQFEDAIAPTGSLVLLGTPLLWTPARNRGGLPPRYLEGGQAKGRKFYFHARPAQGADPRTCIKTGTRLPARIHFTNLTQAELGLLLTALGLHPEHPFPIKLGGGKPVGLGSVQVHLEEIILTQGAESVRQTGRLGQATRLAGDALQKAHTEWCKAGGTLIEVDALEEIESILDKEGLNTTAPADPY
ncbi:CRISPR/Cas system CSM-associated protein Csm3, group 7 of RAMP superfamily [Armatimonadetes bacterium DC]|nr:CRISPR/Cas system CSM-associated protein Csm3, group 7 of RAMP superfamily [Armatimonadetes bacterium DC]